ncbi:MAG TPA: hypothetical protein VM143_06515 [Acidimicrobiales bacterium]|nr:hypothetical protein [Acidimicrobiales bacterium]
MRFQRLLLESGSTTVTLELHPRLTVIAGVAELERESLVTELLAGLAGSRPGTHLEVLTDGGRRLGILHPPLGGRDRVVELEANEDVTEEFSTDFGGVDVLAPYGFDMSSAKRRCRMASRDMLTDATADGAIAHLAAADQGRLWAAADDVRETDARLKAEVAAAGGDPEDAPLVGEVERRHEAFEAAQDRLEYVRHHGIFVGGACVVGAVPAVALHHWASLPLLAAAIVTTLVSIRFRRRMEKARKAERVALERAGAESYLAFRLQRMDTMFDGTDRSRLAHAVGAHRDALTRWQALAGEVSVDLAFDLRERVLAASHRLAEAGGGNAAATAAAAAEPSELAQAMIARMSDLRHAGTGGESLPLILDEPLQGVSPSVKQWMLELISRSAGSPQVVYLTNDVDVANWARMEAVTGELSILEPEPSQDSMEITF